jgi:hypothetical protein
VSLFTGDIYFAVMLPTLPRQKTQVFAARCNAVSAFQHTSALETQ